MAGGVPAMRVAVWNGSSWSAVGPGMQGVGDVDCIALDKSLAAKAIGSQGLGNLYAGGLAYIVGDYANGIDKILVDGSTPNHLSLANVGASTNVVTFLGSPGSNYVLELANQSFPARTLDASVNERRIHEQRRCCGIRLFYECESLARRLLSYTIGAVMGRTRCFLPKKIAFSNN